jgi:hypothetical protein
MGDATKPSDRPPPPFPTLGTAQDIQVLWEAFRAGQVVPCPADAAPVALSVDGTANVYRFVCTSCGLASPWFESGAGAVHVRAHSPESERGGSGGS